MQENQRPVMRKKVRKKVLRRTVIRGETPAMRKPAKFSFVVGLIVFSLACIGQLYPACAEEKISPVQSALSSTTISGYVIHDYGVTPEVPPTSFFDSGASSFSASPVSVVPEPTTSGLVLLGLIAFAAMGKRGQRAQD
jgi:hypothetical protein